MPDKSDERLELEARAIALGVGFAPNIGDEKLAARVAQAEAGKAGAQNDQESPKTSGAAAAAADEGDSARAAGQTGPAATETAGGEQTSPQVAQPAGGEGAVSGATAPAASATAPEKSSAAMVIVKGPRQGRWRAGRHFGPEETKIPVAELTEDELVALDADPALTVTTVDAPY